MYRIDGERLWQSLAAMAEVGPGEAGGSSRLALIRAWVCLTLPATRSRTVS